MPLANGVFTAGTMQMNSTPELVLLKNDVGGSHLKKLDTTNVSILSWNVRGAANATCKRNLKDLVRRIKPDICFIFETHTQFQRLASFWLRLGYKPLAIEEAHGHSGGIWALGLTSLHVQVGVVATHPQAISLRFSSDTASWIGTGVYASPTPSLRQGLWEHLRSVADLVQGSWALIGDFNDIASMVEHRGGVFSPARARAFVDNYESCGLLDLGSFWFSFTWFRHAQGHPLFIVG
ncbi:uncharacterized protein LOC130719131 [Lotus japonicus]|uniref:uncharacterized protein LOC130719131 n=1 Tax=Lotus japonicus TaxID=34305 RepID=UPI00258CBAD5|nr:uncharacterized protein LOC130719131 [Lotus japonicus]